MVFFYFYTNCSCCHFRFALRRTFYTSFILVLMGKINECRLNEQLIYITLDVIICPQTGFCSLGFRTYTPKIVLIHTNCVEMDLCIRCKQLNSKINVNNKTFAHRILWSIFSFFRNHLKNLRQRISGNQWRFQWRLVTVLSCHFSRRTQPFFG